MTKYLVRVRVVTKYLVGLSQNVEFGLGCAKGLGYVLYKLHLSGFLNKGIQV